MVWDSWLKLDRPLFLTEVKRIENCIGEAVSYLSVVTNCLAEAAHREKG